MSAGLAHPGRRPARRRARAAVRPAVPVAGPHRRSGSAGHRPPDAARRDPSDQRDPSGGLLPLGPSHVRLAEPGGAADLARARLGLYPDWPSQAAFAAAAVRGDYAGLLVRADRKRCPGRSAGPGGADRGWRPGQRRLHLPRGPAVHGGLRAINRELGLPRWRRGWPFCDGPAASAGSRAVRRFVVLAEARGYEPETSEARLQFADLSSAIRSVWRGTPPQRCRYCPPPWASARTQWPACCAGWPSPGSPRHGW